MSFGELERVIVNLEKSDLVDYDDAIVMEKLLKMCASKGAKKIWTNNECDSNQTPTEYIFNNNDLFIRAASKREAAVMYLIISQLLKWWTRPLESYHWLEMHADNIGIDFESLEEKITDETLEKILDDIEECSNVSSKIGPPQKVSSFKPKYKAFVKKVHFYLCDASSEKRKVVTRESLLRFLDKFTQ